MEKQNIIISTVPVTIKVMEVGCKKMTMSVFKQIPEYEFYVLENSEIRKSSFLGWVCIEKYGKFFIFSLSGILYKWKIRDYAAERREDNKYIAGLKREMVFKDSENINRLKLEIEDFEKLMHETSMEESETNSYLTPQNQIYISI